MCVAMLKNDSEIKDLVEKYNMIDPFFDSLIRESKNGRKVISYGLSSYGYDVRLSLVDFKIFKRVPGLIVDPKSFYEKTLESDYLRESNEGENYYVLPAHSYGLGVSFERIRMPPNVTAICMGKSTYARVGVIANVTPLEAGWEGHITIEFSNSSDSDCKIYTEEGIIQLLFFEGNPCTTSYADRKGKYQNQGHEITLAKA